MSINDELWLEVYEELDLDLVTKDMSYDEMDEKILYPIEDIIEEVIKKSKSVLKQEIIKRSKEILPPVQLKLFPEVESENVWHT